MARRRYLAAALALGPDAERLVWVARDAEIGDRVADELAAWLGDPSAVATLEPRTALAYERSELVADETAARVAALARWRSGRARVLVASVQALVQHTIAPDDLPDRPLIVAAGERLGLEDLLRRLQDLGYSPVIEVAGRGEFARRGGIVDVFPPSEELPVRIEFFGDEIDSLRRFDPTDQRGVGPVERIELLPASEFLAPRDGIVGLRGRVPGLRTLPERIAADLARFEAASPAAADPTNSSDRAARDGSSGGRALETGDAAEIWGPYLSPATGFDHVDPGTLLILDEPGDIADAAEFLWRQADERRAELVEAGELPKTWPSTYLGPRDWKSRLVGSRTLELTWESEAAGRHGVGRAEHGRRIRVARAVAAARALRRSLSQSVARWQEDGARIVLASDQAPRLAELLAEGGHPVGVSDRLTEAPPPAAIALIERSLNGGFAGGPDGLVFVTDRELFGTVRVRRPRALRRVVPRDILERLTPGDLVVHVDHGIARYERMLKRGAAGEERDYLELAFAGVDKMFVPVEQINRLSRYSGAENPQLSKLGGGEWLRTKARVKKAVSDLAEELLELYASRGAAEGHAFGPDTPVAAGDGGILPVRGDARPAARRRRGQARHGGRAADGPPRRRRRGVRQDRGRAARRVQGDPGRQAGRGAGADDGPRRAAPPDVQPAVRGVPDAGRAALALRRAQGAGGDDRGPRRRLGRHRDRHPPPALEGRPIPGPRPRRGRRGAALRGGREGAPQAASPRSRRADAVRDPHPADAEPRARGRPRPERHRDPARGPAADPDPRRRGVRRAWSATRSCASSIAAGRCSTSTTGSRRSRRRPSSCARCCPGARFAVGHGQMGEGALEKVMIAFAAGATDVLVCTTIIESGLDIPNANTIIIDRADTLGLAQLYQLRGRVGRSSRRAYAYLLYRRRERLSDEARKRLQAIFNASELGAGFQIALADLEIRGAGNILGAQQSGHMAAVGFDLYSRMLAEAVEEQKARREHRRPVVEKPQAVVDLPIEAHLPNDYVPDEAQKLELYRRLARARTGGRPRRVPPGAHRSIRADAGAGAAAGRGGRAAADRGVGRDRVRVARGEPARRPHRHPAALGGHARRSPASGSRASRRAASRFGSNQVRIRLPKDPRASWTLTQAVVTRLVRDRRGIARAGGRHGRDRRRATIALMRLGPSMPSPTSASSRVPPRSSTAERSPSVPAGPSRSATTRSSSRTTSSSSPRRSR